MRRLRLAAILLLLFVGTAAPVFTVLTLAQTTDQLDDTDTTPKKSKRGAELADTTTTPDSDTQLVQLRHGAVRLPFAAALAAVLAMRMRRRGTPPREPAVVHTQIILAIVGAVVMLVVGSSLARAFGIVGAAGLVRYRSKISDPKDAGVMLSTLALGLASGVGLWMLALFTTGFVLVVLWIVESFEPQAMHLFALTVKAKNAAGLRPQVEQLLGRNRLKFELRESSPQEFSYDVHVPIDRHVDRLSDKIVSLAPTDDATVQWEEKKEKK